MAQRLILKKNGIFRFQPRHAKSIGQHESCSMTISFPFLNVVKKRVRSVSGAEVQVVCPVTMALADSGSY